jgi:hypothetical protein
MRTKPRRRGPAPVWQVRVSPDAPRGSRERLDGALADLLIALALEEQRAAALAPAAAPPPPRADELEDRIPPRVGRKARGRVAGNGRMK